MYAPEAGDSATQQHRSQLRNRFGWVNLCTDGTWKLSIPVPEQTSPWLALHTFLAMLVFSAQLLAQAMPKSAPSTGVAVATSVALSIAAAQAPPPDAALPAAPGAESFSESSSAMDPAPQQIPPSEQPPVEQQSPSGQTSPGGTPPATDREQRRARARRPNSRPRESQRILRVFPAFNSVQGGQADPLTSAQKFSLFFVDIVDPYQFAAAGVDSGLQEINDSYPGFHHGVAGLARNYTAAYADDFDGSLFAIAVLPSLLHQNPRYFRLGHGGILHRLFYSLSTAVRCKGDDGRWGPNYSNVLGNLIGGSIANFYYPPADRGFGLAVDRAAIVTAEGSFGSLMVEFYPDVIEHYRLRRARKAAAARHATAGAQP